MRGNGKLTEEEFASRYEGLLKRLAGNEIVLILKAMRIHAETFTDED